MSPKGELVIRTWATPADTNPAGDIFGGWLLGQMDVAGAIYAKKFSKGRTVTVALDAMVFHRPMFVGDVLCCYGHLLKKGNTSLSINIEAWSLREHSQDMVKVTEGHFTYVAIDRDRRPRPIHWETL